ncbi:hypothetical protein SAMN02745166_03575 [Prosthecobacter debontii]|uniref:Antitoxin n=1 Tax=Prosthecobacter debontii TaxID=48467 RepID=A0A1T4YKH3_9BACT|nr:hypothetical protein [Prosthecobacter debontii]SKB02200.1 hypothetical protein SAMN02745166_03575 [Prosthecobacter debontii]
MRLTVNLESDLYALAKSLAKAEDCTISTAINRLLRRSLPGGKTPKAKADSPGVRNGFQISRGAAIITPEMVKQLEAEDDES